MIYIITKKYKLELGGLGLPPGSIPANAKIFGTTDADVPRVHTKSIKTYKISDINRGKFF